MERVKFFYPVEDAYIQDNANLGSVEAAVRYEGTSLLMVGVDNVGKSYSSIVRFDISEIPVNSTIKYAEVSLFLSNIALKDNSKKQLVTARLTEPFKETTLNSLEAPAFEKDSEKIINVGYKDVKNYIGMDITEYVKKWSKREPNYGEIFTPCFLLKSHDSGLLTFNSKENDINKPILAIFYEDEEEIIYVEEKATEPIYIQDLKSYSYYLKNLGTNNLQATLQISSNGYDFIDVSDSIIHLIMNETKVMGGNNEKLHAKYSRIALKSIGTKCTVSFQY
ncbi:hypothetical protein SAMN02745163_01477 [Clostridium cavendishii DSM 21758]|uniref:DNRLRE domain-containing protein n=1 Tax=Clostridium cavendishii DSM 21758 TaxID=1121302 RepID=A0A1M6H435_9CLOT|nr:DNRLRE domain-containing protein [Clostridium cavendishii]SHJ16997.1 hypothetical protein SAMN02745163_01477 [Clostridium cavendishii DSM 21758]